MPSRKPSSFSRRDLLKGAVATAATLAFPTIIPSSALGDDTQAAPSDRLTIGVIGLGKQGAGHHLRGKLLGRPDMQVVALADVYDGRLDYFRDAVDKKYADLGRKDFKGCKGYKDYHELLARNDIDAVLIATPDHWHTAVATEACKAKKDIYCEKPLTLTIGEAKRIIDVVRKYERVFQTGSQQRSEGPFKDVAEYIRNGKLGKIHEVHVAIAGHTSKPCDLPGEEEPKGLLWDVWLGQAPARPYNHVLCSAEQNPDKYPFNPGWRDYREFSGGYVTDWGAHHFDITQWALGMDESGPTEILPPETQGSLYGAKLIYPKTSVGDNIVVTHVERFDEPKVKDNNGILFIGEKGKIFVNRSRAITLPEGNPFKNDKSDSDKVHLEFTPGRDPHHQNWVNCIKSRKKPICDVEIGARSVTVCHLANLAYWHGRKLKWDPQKWEFPGDAEANGWRNREQRKPYELPEA
jgi:predicted dehydrogenase